jgi:hypothetical protein
MAPFRTSRANESLHRAVLSFRGGRTSADADSTPRWLGQRSLGAWFRVGRQVLTIVNGDMFRRQWP